jgi:hypothetical protein
LPFISEILLNSVVASAKLHKKSHIITNNEKKKPKSQQKVVILPREVTQKIR